MDKTDTTTITLGTALDVFAENMHDIKSTLLNMIVNRIKTVEEEHSFFIPANKTEKYIWNECVTYSIKQAIEIPQKTLNRITAREQQALTPSSNYITDEHIATAKEYPIQELYEGNLRHGGGKYVGTCPFHNEKTASFFIFTKNNTFKCFGCGIQGDSIAFYMKAHNTTFHKSVRALQKL
jgi:hypothetical protein